MPFQAADEIIEQSIQMIKDKTTDLLICPTHKRLHSILTFTNLKHGPLGFRDTFVLRIIESKAKALAPLDHCPPELRAPLPNPAREHDRIHVLQAPELQEIRANVRQYTVHEYIKRQRLHRVLSFLASAVGDDGKVRCAREALPAALLVQDLLRVRDLDGLGRTPADAPRGGREVEDERGVDGPGARRARQAVQRRQAHGGVERLAVVDRADGRPGPEVQHDERGLGDGEREEGGGGAQDV